MSSMLTPPRPRARASSATIPGLIRRPSDAARSSGPPASSASSRPRRASPARALPVGESRRYPLRGSARRRRRRRSAARLDLVGEQPRCCPCRCRPRSLGSRRRPASRRESSGRSPDAARRRPRRGTSAACSTRTLASTCGRWLTVAIRRSCSAASIACGRAPISAISALHPVVDDAAGLGRRRQIPAGAVEEVSHARSRRPTVSAPARGWPPRKRGSCPRAATAAALDRTDVGHGGVGAGGLQGFCGDIGKRANGGGTEDDGGLLDRVGQAGSGLVDRRRASVQGQAAQSRRPSPGPLRPPPSHAWRARSIRRSDRPRGPRRASERPTWPSGARAPQPPAGRGPARSSPSPCRRR